jgi:preprotein translocase subunit SecA
MRTSNIPAPGILLGRYPERRDRSMAASTIKALFTQCVSWRGHRIARYERFVAQARALERQWAGEPADAVRARIPALRAYLARDGLWDNLLAQAFAIAALECRRQSGIAPYDTQLMAARTMLDNHLVELATGEGKTLAAAIAAAAAALAGVPVHVITSNDYLVGRDAAALSPLYAALGLTTGMVTQGMGASARRNAYACDITYCTAKELVFDYLRDGMTRPRGSDLEQRAARLAAKSAPGTLLRGLCLAIVDEADSILIDEARVPLILSHAPPGDSDPIAYRDVWNLSTKLASGADFVLDPETRTARLTDAGKIHVRKLTAGYSAPLLIGRHCEDAVMTALAARYLLHRDRDYLVRAGKVLIIDENTGRATMGRAWSQGLHQIVEIKEGCPPSAQSAPVAQITYQRFFPRYLRLCGMSGTLTESRGELLSIYDLDVIRLPLRLPSRRSLLPARVFETRQAQWAATVARVRELHAQGRPVLLGTDSVKDSEELSKHLTAAGLPHTVLNARQDEEEAQVIAAAGMRGAITVATNMAGRGTDIALDAGVGNLGGLHVISCQQNAVRRIDRQLIGRCARQGAPGSAETFITLDGPLLAGRLSTRLAKPYARGEMRRLRWLGVLLFRITQWGMGHRQRQDRKILLRRDKEINRWLAFSGPEE